MLWRLWLSVSLGVATIAGSIDGHRSLNAAGPPDHDVTDARQSLLLRMRAVEFRLVLGRLELDPPRHRKGSNVERIVEPAPLEEAFTVTAERGIPSLHYTRRTLAREVIVDVVDAVRVRITSHLLNADEHLDVTQPPDGAVLVRFRSKRREETFRCPSLLHLAAARPALFERHLQPVLNCLLPELSLPKLRHEATEQLLALAADVDPPSHDRVVVLVDQLAARERLQRDVAHAELLEYGVAVLPLLDRIRPADLGTEQRLRLKAIRGQLRPRGADDAARIARWLVTDAEYWNAIAVHLTEPEQRLAHRHLQRIHGEGLQPAPAGPTRVAQTPESSVR